jgi:hypothetical protein
MGQANGRLDGGRGESASLYSRGSDQELIWTELTKEDRDIRKAAIDAETARLIERGMAKTRAKTVATERWDEKNPWFKAGNTRGKV